MNIGEILKWIEFVRRIIECLTDAGVIHADTPVKLENGHLEGITRAVARSIAED